MTDGELKELGDVVNFPSMQEDGERRWIVLFEEDYDNVMLDPDGNLGVLVDLNQTAEIMRLVSEVLSGLSHRDAEGDEPIRDMIDALEEVLEYDE